MSTATNGVASPEIQEAASTTVPDGVMLESKTLCTIVDPNGKIRTADEDTASGEQAEAEAAGRPYEIAAIQTFGIPQITGDVTTGLNALIPDPTLQRDFVNRALFAKCNTFANNQMKSSKKVGDKVVPAFEAIEGTYNLVAYVGKPPQREVLSTFQKVARQLEALYPDAEQRKVVLQQLQAMQLGE